MTARRHHHRAHNSDERCYTHCVDPENCDPAAHGGITYRQTCRCGAERLINANNNVAELGRWYEVES